ncbi:MAG: 30S ribosomal protein S6 [Patescibacteria group bacterium]
MQDKEVEVNTGAKEAMDPNSKVYELGFLLVSTIAEDDLAAKYDIIKQTVTSLKGEFISDEMPKMITLAYPMQKVVANIRNKFTTAYFGWIKFTMEKDQVIELKKSLDLNPIVLRFLILKTVKENTIAAKRFFREDGGKRVMLTKKGDEEEKIGTPIDKEKIDQEIDALVS